MKNYQQAVTKQLLGKKGENMEAKDYQKEAARTLIEEPGLEPSNNEIMIVWNALGLAGEAGEVADLIKKGVFHQHGLDKEKLKKELGDCLWYIAALCSNLGLDLGDVMQSNIDKLKLRYPNGFTTEDSKKRIDMNGS